MDYNKDLKGKLSFNESMLYGFDTLKGYWDNTLPQLAFDYQIAFAKGLGEFNKEPFYEKLDEIVATAFGRLKSAMTYYINEKFMDEFNENLPSLEYKFVSSLTERIKIDLDDLLYDDEF